MPADGFKIASAFVEVEPDTEGFRERLEAAVKEAVDGVEAKVKVGMDKEEFDADAEDVKSKVAELDDSEAKIRITGEDEEWTASADEAKAKRDELDGSEAKVRITGDNEELSAVADDSKEKLSELDGAEASPKLGLNDDEFTAKKDSADARLEANDALVATPKLALDDTEFQETLAKDKSEAAAASSGGGEGGGSMFGAIGLGAGMLMPGLAGATTGLATLAGVGATALEPILKTLSAAHQASMNVGLTSAQLAQTEFTNSVQIKQAQVAVGQAHRQAAADAVASAEAIESSQLNLSEVERNASTSEIQALQGVTQAQQQVQEANVNLASAQYNLSMAWIQAKYNLQQLNDAEKNQATTLAAAHLAVAQAKHTQLLTDQNAYSTSLDRQQAAIAVKQSEEQLTSTQQQATETAKEAHLEDKRGVSGSQQVVQAQQAVKTAVYGVRDAAMQLEDAQRNLRVTQLNNATQIKQAQLQVKEAEQQAAFQQQNDAVMVQQAELNLTDTIKQQKLAWASMLSTENQAANQFAHDFARLSPAAQHFVTTILSMRGAWHRLVDETQTAIMPGLLTFVHGIRDIFPSLTLGARLMGHAISDAFGQFGRLMQTQSFAHVFDGLIRNGVQFANIVLPAFAQFIGELAKIGSQKGAVSGLANLLAGVAHGLTGLATSVGHYIPQINQFLDAAGVIIANIGPPLGQIIGLIAETLGPLTRYLNAHPNGTVAKVIGDVVAGLIAFKGLQKVLGGPFEFLINFPTKIKGGWDKLSGLWDKAYGGMAMVGRGAYRVFGPGGMVASAWDSAGQLAGRVFGEGGLLSRAWSGAGQVAYRVFGEGGVIAQAWEKSGQLAVKVFGEGGLVEQGASGLMSFGSRVGQSMLSAGQSVASFVSGAATQLAEATTATVAWVGEHAAAVAAYVAENVTAAASATAAFIAENAATLGIAGAIALLVTGITLLATHWSEVWSNVKRWAEDAWHFIADGFGKYLLPLLGPVGYIALGALELSQHWQQIWGGIKQTAQDFYNWLWTDFGQKIETFFVKTVPGWWDQFVGLANTHLAQPFEHILQNLYNWVWTDFGQKIETFFTRTIPGWWDSFWGATKRTFDRGVSDLRTIWGKLEGFFKTPVNFLINTVYDNGIARLWNDVAGKIPGVPHMPHIGGLAGGGITPGMDHGHDAYMMPMRPGEGVLTPPTVQGLGGPGAVYALNNAFDPTSNKPPGGQQSQQQKQQQSQSGQSGQQSQASAAGKELTRQARRRSLDQPALHLVGLAGGGTVADALANSANNVKEGSGGSTGGGGLGGFISGAWHDIVGGVKDAYTIGRLASALVSGNTTAFVNAFTGFFHTPASGQLAKMMIGLPKQLVTDAVHGVENSINLVGRFVEGMVLPHGGSGAVGSLPENWKTIASFLASHGFSKFAAAGVTGNIDAESTGDPEILQAGGGGGGGLIQWTPYPAGYITGDVQKDLYTQLNAILSWGGGPGMVNKATSPSNAAQIYQDFYERPASLTASLPQRMASANAVYKAMGWGQLDQGGYLMPPINATGQAERVLDPAQTRAFDRLVEYLTTRGGDGAGMAPNVQLIYNGPQEPTPEMKANQMRDLAMALSGP